MFERVTSILRVENLQTSRDYYVDKLGFNVDWTVGTMMGISRDKASFMMCEKEQGNPGTWVWFGVNDAQELYEEYIKAGVEVRHAPRNYPWALEFHLKDPDGHVLRFGSEPIKDRPYEEFLE